MYEVRVLVKKKNGHPRYVYGLGDKFHPAKRDFAATGEYTYDEEIETKHVWAKSTKQAGEEAKKYGVVQSVGKAHSQKTIYGNIEKVLEKKREKHGTALELEELPWLYMQKEKERERDKVRDRRDNAYKDKSKILLDF
jgi:hypothetical protein